jgi:hypothetical protein
MDFFINITSIIPPSVSLIIGILGIICLFILIFRKPKDKKIIGVLTAGYILGGLAFLPLMLNVLKM